MRRRTSVTRKGETSSNWLLDRGAHWDVQQHLPRASMRVIVGTASRSSGLTCGYSCVRRYEKKLLRFMEDLIHDMDRKIKQNRERAERESAPRELKPEDQARLNELQQRARGGRQISACSSLAWQ